MPVRRVLTHGCPCAGGSFSSRGNGARTAPAPGRAGWQMAAAWMPLPDEEQKEDSSWEKSSALLPRQDPAPPRREAPGAARRRSQRSAGLCKPQPSLPGCFYGRGGPSCAPQHRSRALEFTGTISPANEHPSAAGTNVGWELPATSALRSGRVRSLLRTLQPTSVKHRRQTHQHLQRSAAAGRAGPAPAHAVWSLQADGESITLDEQGAAPCDRIGRHVSNSLKKPHVVF